MRQSRGPLTAGHPEVNLVAEVSVAAVCVSQVLGAQTVEGLSSRDQLHLGDAGAHVVLHAIQVEDGDHAGPICFTRVVGLQAAGTCTQQSYRTRRGRCQQECTSSFRSFSKLRMSPPPGILISPNKQLLWNWGQKDASAGTSAPHLAQRQGSVGPAIPNCSVLCQ